MDKGQRFSFMFNSGGADFTAWEVALLDCLRRPLVTLLARAVSA